MMVYVNSPKGGSHGSKLGGEVEGRAVAMRVIY